MNLKYNIPIIISITSLIVLLSCKKEYERPDEFTINLFENERKKDNSDKILTDKEALDLSKLSIIVDSVELLDSSKKDNKTLFIYKISGGKIIKGNKDSLSLPMNILSTKEIKPSSSPFQLYLEKLKYFKLLIKDFNVTYQLIDRAPIE